MRRLALLALVLAAAAGAAAPARATAKPFLWQCEQISNAQVQWDCYVGRLLQVVDRSGDPANELPRIDRLAHAAGGFLEGNCHVLMHQVGRDWAREHHLTLDELQQYVPRSNDPGCSAGFGMGLVIYLGPSIIGTGGKSAVRTCEHLATRYREYTCFHGLGHAISRAYHANLPSAVRACLALGRRVGPDCTQGAFHDYWISLRGADEATRPTHADASARSVCGRYPKLALQCWYRYFVEQPLAPQIAGAVDMRRACRGLAGAQRAGCIAGTALALPVGPFEQQRICARLAAADAVACLRGVTDQSLAGRRRSQLRLVAGCARMPAGARVGCYSWLGRTLNVVDDGRFLRAGCGALAARSARAACTAGARAYGQPLLTFS